MKGIPASELTHRDTFSAFEGNVEDRDVISSYLPVYEPGTTDKLVGVFEIYSDVTPFLAQINETSANIQAIADDNLQQVQTRAALNQADIEKSSTTMFIIILGLLVVLFLALYLIVRRADRIIKEQEDEKEKGQMQLAQSEKMASLGQMVAGVAHQLNTPIAFSHSNLTMIKESVQEYEPVTRAYTKIAEHFSKTDKNRITLTMNKNKDELVERAENLPETAMITEMLDDTLNGLHQMGELVENLQNFTRLDRAKTDKFDVTSGLKNVIYIAKSVIPTGITINEAYANLPEVTCNPSQLNQVFLNLINNAAHALQGSGTINISTQQVGSNIEIKFEDNGTGIPPDVLPHIFDMYFTTKPEGEGTGMGLGIARTITQEHGGDINVESTVNVGTIVTVTLPIDL
jgi:signal transduction histidine kinase